MTTPSPLALQSSYAAGVLVIEATGEIDMATAPEITAAIEGALTGTKGVVIDLTNVDFLDSSALNAFVHSRRELAARGVAFNVVSPSGHPVRRVFEITQLLEELGVVASRAEILSVK